MLRFLFTLFAAAFVTVAAAQPVPATDAQIEAKLHDKLAKSVIGKDGFVAKVKGGVVYWEGSTVIAQHKGAATRMAKSSGARRVVNNIVVRSTVGNNAKVKKPAEKKPAPAKQASAAPSAAPEPASQPAPAPAPELKRVTVKWRP